MLGHGGLNAGKVETGPLVFLHVGIAQAVVDRRARAIDLAARDRIGAIIGGVECARAMVAGKADPAERSVRGSAVGRLVPVDDAGPDTGPEFVVLLGSPADQA